MTAEQPSQDPQRFIVETIEMLLRRRLDDVPEIVPDARLQEDLTLDSLELAELSVLLEDNLGRDPYTEGIVPRTVDDVAAFYR